METVNKNVGSNFEKNVGLFFHVLELSFYCLYILLLLSSKFIYLSFTASEGWTLSRRKLKSWNKLVLMFILNNVLVWCPKSLFLSSWLSSKYKIIRICMLWLEQPFPCIIDLKTRKCRQRPPVVCSDVILVSHLSPFVWFFPSAPHAQQFLLYLIWYGFPTLWTLST